jgi:hypothetical protein
VKFLKVVKVVKFVKALKVVKVVNLVFALPGTLNIPAQRGDGAAGGLCEALQGPKNFEISGDS